MYIENKIKLNEPWRKNRNEVVMKENLQLIVSTLVQPHNNKTNKKCLSIERSKNVIFF